MLYYNRHEKYMYVYVYVLGKNQGLDFTQYRAGFLQIEIESERRISKNPKRLHKKCYFQSRINDLPGWKC